MHTLNVFALVLTILLIHATTNTLAMVVPTAWRTSQMAKVRQELLSKHCRPNQEVGIERGPKKKFGVQLMLTKMERCIDYDDFQTSRSPLLGGSWKVQYTDCVPPSNGKLGPLRGEAFQHVDLENRFYVNELRIGGDKLTAKLNADYVEWDGVIPSSTVPKFIDRFAKDNCDDPGAYSWLVTFRNIEFALFGVKVFTMKFPEGTTRVWKHSYVDETTRVTRAGRTGATDDEYVFFMTRV